MIPQVEQNYYKDIRRIAKALESIEKHLSAIADVTKRTDVVEPLWFYLDENVGYKKLYPVDDSSVRGMIAKMSCCCDDACMIDDGK